VPVVVFMASIFGSEVFQPIFTQHGQMHPQPQSPMLRPQSQQCVHFDANLCSSLYVGNLPISMTETLLYQLFASVGNVVGAKLKRDKNVSMDFSFAYSIDWCELRLWFR